MAPGRVQLPDRRLRLSGVVVAGCGALLVACGPRTAGGSACEGLSERKLGIGREEHLPCAGAITASLDTLGRQLESVLDGDTTALDAARSTARDLRRHLRHTGLETDYRSLRPGTMVERWPDAEVRAFNDAAFDAAFHYSTFLASRFDRTPSRFEEGVRAHDRAREAYRRLQ